MKKLLLLFVLISGFIFGQDLNYAESLNNLSVDQLRNVSQDILSGYRGVYKYNKTFVNYEGETVLVYYSSDIPESDVLADSKKQFCSLCTEFKFKKYIKNKNSDLEIKGFEAYKFVGVEGKYLDLYQWWIKHFASTETKESLLESNKRYVKSYKPSVNIRFTKTLDTWEISNIY